MKVRSETDKKKILREAKSRFKRAEEWEAKARILWLSDVKFCEGDSDNLWQWPEEVRQPREEDTRPMLTINKTRQHVLDVLNDARQSRVAIKIVPTGGQATYDSAQAYMGVVRAIEYQSNAEAAYQHALKHAMQGGWGYWRVLTEYVSNDTFDKKIVIRRVQDPLMVYLDPDINEADGSDANWGFVAVKMPREEFKVKHPKYKDMRASTEFGAQSWVDENHVIVAEYWRRVQKPDKLLAYMNPVTGKKVMGRYSQIPKHLRAMILADENTQSRDIFDFGIEWFKLVGDEIAEELEWEGIYVPLVRVIGEETIIDNVLDRKGHVRALKDPQRMFNYNASGFVEHGALQTKVPYVTPAAAIEENQADWEEANTRNFAVLTYNHRDDDGDIIPPPQRAEAPKPSALYIEGMNASAEWLRMASGQYQADMGAPSNERSGAAITARQRQGDIATYHYLDHQSLAIRFTGKILIDLIPKIYDTARVLKYKGEDGTEQEIHLDPEQPQAVQTEKLDESSERTIFNPTVGEYDVESDVGPSFQTKRQDAWAAYTQILAQNKELTSVIGDLALQFADFPGADEAARRLKRMVPAQALDESGDPQIAALKQQISQAEQFIQMLSQKLKDKTGDTTAKHDKNSIDAYRAQSDRLGVLKEALGLDKQGLLVLVREVLEEAQATSAGGGALSHVAEPVPEAEDIHPAFGGQQQAPAPPMDPNAAPPAPGT